MAPNVSSDSSSTTCFGLASQWLKQCLETHQSCNSVSRGHSILPTRVIRVGQHPQQPSLHQSASGETGAYATLSYCWGKSEQLTSTLSTVAQRERGFALEQLPKTCRDAIIIARRLSIPYLWIDALCIIQDSADDWEREAARMHSVYKNSLVTMAAIDSPESTSGCFLNSEFRTSIRTAVTDAPGQDLCVHTRKSRPYGSSSFTHSLSLDESILKTRGWTLQELVLSPRILNYTHSELSWQCKTVTACECQPWPKSRTRNNEMWASTTFDLEFPYSDRPEQLHAYWRRVVEEYTKRDLTHPSDRLPGLSGIAANLHERLGGDYMMGIWSGDIAAGLLWADMSNLNMGCPKDSLALGADYAPSWSWASTTCRVGFDLGNPSRVSPDLVVHRTEYSVRELNPYGPGKGSLFLKGALIPLRLHGNGLYYSNEQDFHLTKRFCHAEEECLPDSRMAHRVPISQSLFFLHVGHTRCVWHGLLVEPVDTSEKTFQRLGFISISLTSQKCEAWEKCKIQRNMELV